GRGATPSGCGASTTGGSSTRTGIPARSRTPRCSGRGTGRTPACGRSGWTRAATWCSSTSVTTACHCATGSARCGTSGRATAGRPPHGAGDVLLPVHLLHDARGQPRPARVGSLPVPAVVLHTHRVRGARRGRVGLPGRAEGDGGDPAPRGDRHPRGADLPLPQV